MGAHAQETGVLNAHRQPFPAGGAAPEAGDQHHQGHRHHQEQQDVQGVGGEFQKEVDEDQGNQEQPQGYAPLPEEFPGGLEFDAGLEVHRYPLFLLSFLLVYHSAAGSVHYFFFPKGKAY